MAKAVPLPKREFEVLFQNVIVEQQVVDRQTALLDAESRILTAIQLPR